MKLDIKITLNKAQEQLLVETMKEIVAGEVTRQLAWKRNEVLKNE